MKKLLLLLVLTGCATPPQKPAPVIGWTPSAQWWASASLNGGRLIEREGGPTHVVTATQARNLQEALDKLSKESGISPRLALIKSDQMNAFATERQGVPTVGFTLPFIQALGDDKDAIASVMGHELAHLHLQHGAARKERHETARAASNVLGTVLNVVGVPLGGAIAGLGVGVVTASFSRDEEREADELGNKWATSAGFDPCGGARSMRVLQQQGKTAPIPFLATHPGHDERIERANGLSLKLKGANC
jgi:predicted Zn-dependent protease